MNCRHWGHRLWYAHTREVTDEYIAQWCFPRIHIRRLRAHAHYIPHNDNIFPIHLYGPQWQVRDLVEEVGPEPTYAKIMTYLHTNPDCEQERKP